MVTLDVRILTVPVGIVRILEVVFTCVSFSLVASVGHKTDSFWTWCIFSWCFCFCITFLIIILEFTSLSPRLHISWEDFTAAFSMLATLMVLTASIIYSVFFTCSNCGREIGACFTSFLTFTLYAVEVGMTRAKDGEISGFLSTVPGILKVLEAFVACIIFICLAYNPYSDFQGLQWCVAVYCICFIFALLVIICTICRLLFLFPKQVLIVCNVLAVLMYITAVVIWPLYNFRDSSQPHCPNIKHCKWNMLVVITFMTCVNLVAYIVDTVYSFKLVLKKTPAMAHVDLRAITQPIGIIRVITSILTLTCFILAASAGHFSSSYWAWCLFTWFFCFFFTLLILVLEFTKVSAKLPFAWDDFPTAFAILASLMCISASIIYPILFTCKACPRQIGTSVISWICFGLYVSETVLTHLRPGGQSSGFLSTLPGIMKMLETFVACLIFIALKGSYYSNSPELQWCVAVYSLCFIFAVIIILLTLGQMTSFFPFSFDMLATIHNIVAAVMYMTAMVIWPLYSYHGIKRPPTCGKFCEWDELVLVTFMTIFNFIVYTLDTIYSIRVVFCVRTERTGD
ncbi:uncharacterized protein FYW49_015350 [Xenentodon cancila]